MAHLVAASGFTSCMASIDLIQPPAAAASFRPMQLCLGCNSFSLSSTVPLTPGAATCCLAAACKLYLAACSPLPTPQRVPRSQISRAHPAHAAAGFGERTSAVLSALSGDDETALSAAEAAGGCCGP